MIVIRYLSDLAIHPSSCLSSDRNARIDIHEISYCCTSCSRVAYIQEINGRVVHEVGDIKLAVATQIRSLEVSAVAGCSKRGVVGNGKTRHVEKIEDIQILQLLWSRGTCGSNGMRFTATVLLAWLSRDQEVQIVGTPSHVRQDLYS